MKNPAILLLNGSSGVGKTTIATLLNKMQGVDWIHPDALWDPNMDQGEATFKAIKLAVDEHQDVEIVVIDKQFRHQFMLDAFTEYGVTVGNQILLYCNSSDRRHRLLARGCTDDVIETMDNWAQWLYEDSKTAGNVTIDTSTNGINEVVDIICSYLSTWMWQFGGSTKPKMV